jgi:phosphoglycolate phosphatase-like HAD superfamily hydrolase
MGHIVRTVRRAEAMAAIVPPLRDRFGVRYAPVALTRLDVLAMDFDGVLCDGMREYFEASRRSCARIWPEGPAPGDETFPAFARLRPVIMTGWEMPVLLRAIAGGHGEAAVLQGWEGVRDEVLAKAPGLRGEALVDALKRTLDEVRRDWIAADPRGWLELNVPYGSLDELRRLVAEPGRAVLVTTKEGEFARRILDHWGVRLADIKGKEAGTHKCENLRSLIADHAAAHGRRPRLWFIEDRLETLQHVTTHADLDDVGLFLAAWGYNTPETRASVRGDRRIRLLELAQFRQGLAAWASPSP